MDGVWGRGGRVYEDFSLSNESSREPALTVLGCLPPVSLSPLPFFFPTPYSLLPTPSFSYNKDITTNKNNG